MQHTKSTSSTLLYPSLDNHHTEAFHETPSEIVVDRFHLFPVDIHIGQSLEDYHFQMRKSTYKMWTVVFQLCDQCMISHMISE